MVDSQAHDHEVASRKQFTGQIQDAEDVLPVTSLGDGIKLIREEKIKLDKENAKTHLELAEFPGERPLRNEHVETLLMAMRRRTFREEQVRLMTATDMETKIQLRMNGQHTCWAVFEHPDPKFHLRVTMMTYECQTMQDVRQLYASIDRGAPRTKGNVVVSYLAGTPQFEGIESKRIIQMLAAGFGFWRWDTIRGRTVHDGDDVAYLMQTEFANVTNHILAWVRDEPSHITTPHMCRAAVVGAMYATFNKAPRLAAEFWTAIHHGTGLDSVDDPRLRLRNQLMRSGTGAKLSREDRVLAETMYRWCIFSWNRWREGRGMKQLHVSLLEKRPSAK